MWCVTYEVIFPDCAGVWLFLSVLVLVIVLGIVLFAMKDL